MSGVATLLIGLAYLASAVLFIVGLKRLSSPATARSGNRLAAIGMLVAVLATLLDTQIIGFTWIVVGLAAGTVIGVLAARMVQMTAMPQMVAIFNGLGGGASALVAGAEYIRATGGEVLAGDAAVTIVLSVLVGTVTFSGSLVAFGKLQEIVTGRAVQYPMQKAVNALLFIGILAVGGALVVLEPSGTLLAVFAAAALLLGVLLVLPIGGADMPVIVSLLNSYSGLAAAATGFVLQNNALIISGALVGASGLILTRIMCRAMNRSLANVLFGAFGAAAESDGGADGEERPVSEVTPEDAAILMGYARKVLIVPGYGMAVAQAQHSVRDLADLLEERGVEVRYAIHPVAGRMPGHMNVLLAEANVPYPQLLEMEEANQEMGRTDVALVIGANDTVNPAANDVPDSPLYGMPIVEAYNAQTVIVMKRSLNPGFAGVDNPLFYRDNARMLFGDAKASLGKLVSELKQLQTA